MVFELKSVTVVEITKFACSLTFSAAPCRFSLIAIIFSWYVVSCFFCLASCERLTVAGVVDRNASLLVCVNKH